MSDAAPIAPGRPPFRILVLFTLLGFSAGLPFYLFSTVLFLRLTRNGADLMVIGFFAWVALLPTFKFLWAPLLDRYQIPGFSRVWGRRRGWILLSQLGIASAIVGLGLAHPDQSLAATAFWAVLLAFWTTTLEVAADAWRIELAPTAEGQGLIVAASLWGYRSAMVAAGSGVLILADGQGWVVAYLMMAIASFIPFPLLLATRPESEGLARRITAITTGIAASALILIVFAGSVLAIGSGVLLLTAAASVTSQTNVTPVVLAIAMTPFVLMAIAIPHIRRLGPNAPARASTAIGPYVDVFWRYGFATIAILAFVSLYRMGDVLALTLSKPLVNSIGYTLTQIGVADGAVALASSMAGVGLGGLCAAMLPRIWALTLGAVLAAVGNFAFVWLAAQPPSDLALYAATAADQFGNGFAGTAFVVYLSLLVNPRYAGAQYAFLSGFAFLLPRLIAGSSGAIEARIGYDGFFIMSGALSLAAIAFLPLILRCRPRQEDHPDVAKQSLPPDRPCSQQ